MDENHKNKLRKSLKKKRMNLDFEKKRKEGIKRFNNNLPDKIREIRRQNGLKNKGIKRTKEFIQKQIESARKRVTINPNNRINSYHREWRKKIVERDKKRKPRVVPL